MNQETGAADPEKSPITGVFFQHSTIAVKNIEDGTSNTYMFVEKYLAPDNYEDGLGDGDSMCWLSGATYDTGRDATEAPSQDTIGREDHMMGSSHPVTFNAVFCDGHVASINYSVDCLVHRGTANRGSAAVNSENCW